MLDEGGYYAIKGFTYQYVVSLIEVLKCYDESKTFCFEQLQDFNDNEVIYQMKYKETQNYTNSKIKEPTIKLFLEYLDNKKDYILYVYFSDKNDQTLVFNSVEELDKVLLNCKIDKEKYSFTEEQKKEFIQHFKVIFSKDYIEKCNELIELISEAAKVSKDVAEVYLYSMVTYIINIIAKNEPKSRNCTKKDLLLYISNSSTKIFYEYYMKYYSKERYLQMIKNEYFFEKNINNHNRIFVINFPNASTVDYYECICKIVKRFYVTNKKETMIISGTPYVYLNNVNAENLAKIKAKLFESIKFIDGYMYKDADFNIDYITKEFTVNEKVFCKLISTEENLWSIIDKIENKGIKIYEFYKKQSITNDKNANSISIEVDGIEDVFKILK